MITVGAVLFHVFALVILAAVLSKEANRLSAHSYLRTLVVLSSAVLANIAVHTVEAWCWAIILWQLGEFADLQTALYFAVVAATTLGYGDLTLSESWRLLGTFVAMGGLILLGTSTAFLIELMRRFFTPFRPANTNEPQA